MKAVLNSACACALTLGQRTLEFEGEVEGEKVASQRAKSKVFAMSKSRRAVLDSQPKELSSKTKYKELALTSPRGLPASYIAIGSTQLTSCRTAIPVIAEDFLHYLTHILGRGPPDLVTIEKPFFWIGSSDVR